MRLFYVFTKFVTEKPIDPCYKPTVCQSGLLVPDPENCQQYFACSFDLSWKLETCQNGLLFNNISLTCRNDSISCAEPCPPYTGTTATTLSAGKSGGQLPIQTNGYEMLAVAKELLRLIDFLWLVYIHQWSPLWRHLVQHHTCIIPARPSQVEISLALASPSLHRRWDQQNWSLTDFSRPGMNKIR